MILNTRIIISLGSILAMTGLLIGGTFAYFTAQDTTEATEIVETADFDINLTIESAVPVSNLLPGETVDVVYQVKNNGSVPMHIRLAGLANWVDAPTLDSTMVTSIEAAYFDGTDWIKFAENPNGFSDWVEYTDSVGGNLKSLDAQETISIQVTMKLDETAGNEYIGQSYRGIAVVQAKQINAPVWTEQP